MNEFDESKHPRDADGKFTDKNSSQTSATSATKLIKPIDDDTSESQPKGSITSSGNSKDLIKTNKLSLKEFSRLSFDEQLDEYAKGNVEHDISLRVGNVPEIYKQVGSQGESIFISKSILDKVVKTHDISINELKLIPKKLEDPLYIFKGNSPNPNSIVSVIDMVNNHGERIIVPIYMNATQGKRIVDRVASIYGKDDFEIYKKEQINKGNMLYKK